MAETESKLPVKGEKGTVMAPAASGWGALEGLHREIDRLFDAFDGGFWSSPFRRAAFGVEPFWKRELTWTATPAVDIAESDKSYEITAELPGMDEKNIEVKLSNVSLTIRGEKQEKKEEKKKDYCVQERRFGSFERSFVLPEGIDRDKIEANFGKGVLTVKLPKTAEAQKAEKKIAIKVA
jgi:HSP20 family protein